MNKAVGKSFLYVMSGLLVLGNGHLIVEAKGDKTSKTSVEKQIDISNKTTKAEKLIVTEALLSKNASIKKKQVELLNLKKDVSKLEIEIKRLNKELEQEVVLEAKKEELKELKRKLDKTIKQYGERITAIQTNGDSENRLFEVLFNSKSVGDMISKTLAFKSIAEADEGIVEDIKRDSAFLEEETKKLQVEMDALNKKKKEALLKKESLHKKKQTIEKELKKMKKSERERLELEFKKQMERKKRLEQKLKEQKELEKKLKAEQDLAESTRELEDNAQRAFEALKEVSKEALEENGEYFIQPTTGVLTQHAGHADGSNGYDVHTGMDIANPSKPPVVASMKGEVVRAVHGNTGYGNYVKIKHQVGKNVYYTLYGHLDFIGVNEGERVEQGELIGIMGTTGNSTGVHLHFEILDSNEKWMDPEAFYTFNDPKAKPVSLNGNKAEKGKSSKETKTSSKNLKKNPEKKEKNK